MKKNARAGIHEAMKDAREAAAEAIVGSPSRKKLVVAGPGTGKTFTFKKALAAVGNKGVALTFIRALVKDLERDLGSNNLVNTFHGFCKHLLHRSTVKGLSARFTYFPPLLRLLSRDLEILGRAGLRLEDLEGAFQELDDSKGLISDALGFGDYYDAVSHTDLVYRVLRHFEENPELVPVYPLVVVDEYQDFNRLETRFIDVLATRSPVLIAGDDDQALYDFKRATPGYIRQLARDVTFSRFELPYCSRCTEVVVGAVNNVVRTAVSAGHLTGRVNRRYECFLPDKEVDSKAYPSILHATCSVERKAAPYIGRYVEQQIGMIPREHIVESREGPFPTALVIGRRHFVKPVYEVLRKRYPQTILRLGTQPEVDLLDGYRLLARDEKSRLGWRIILELTGLPGKDSKVADCLRDCRELVEVLDRGHRAEHVGVARILRALIGGEKLSKKDQLTVETALGRKLAEIRQALARDEEPEVEEERGNPEADAPSVICTSLLGAKGLSAEHVFIVGFNDEVFPQDPGTVTDHEICSLIVGLSRTRKQCHLVSCRNWSGRWLNPSSFLGWLGVSVQERVVDKTYWKK